MAEQEKNLIIDGAAPQPLLTRADLQAVLKMSARTIGRLLIGGGLPPPILVGRSYRWRSRDIEKFIAEK
jgi:predicted DNA-binding transcriptional regulator AlpA